jgi:hypothetical protein
MGRIPSNPPLSQPLWPPNKPLLSPPQQHKIRIRKMGLIPPCLLSDPQEAADKLLILLPPNIILYCNVCLQLGLIYKYQ